MVNNKIKVGIVGLGYLGKFHFEKYQANKSVNLTCVVDINDKNLKSLSQIMYINHSHIMKL